jgi:hypothetical protein
MQCVCGRGKADWKAERSWRHFGLLVPVGDVGLTCGRKFALRTVSAESVFESEEKPHSVFQKNMKHMIPLVDVLISANGKAIELLTSQRDQDHPIFLKSKERLSMMHNAPLFDAVCGQVWRWYHSASSRP